MAYCRVILTTKSSAVLSPSAISVVPNNTGSGSGDEGPRACSGAQGTLDIDNRLQG